MIKHIVGKYINLIHFKKNVPKSGIITIKHLGFTWNLNLEHYLDRSIAQGKIWEELSIHILTSLVKPGMQVIDVGANFGYYSLIMSQLIGENGRVIAFEPTNDYFTRLKEHVRINNVKNIRLEKMGLSNDTKELEISIGNSSATIHPGYYSLIEPRSKEIIQLMKFDDWWNNYISMGNLDQLDFMKIDIDGHEPFFLKGAYNTLKKHKPVLLIEFAQEFLYYAHSSVFDLIDMLESLHYILCDEKDGKPYADKTLLLKDAGNFAYSKNVIAIPTVND